MNDLNQNVTMPHSLIMMAGSVGAGKSTLAKELGERINCPVIDKDVVKSRLLISGVTGPIAAVAYEIGFDICKQLLTQGFSVILDTPLRSPETLGRAVQLGKYVGVDVKILYCEAKQTIRNERLSKRQGMACQWNKDDRSDAEEEEVFAFLTDRAYRLDSSLPLDQLVPLATSYLIS